MKIGPLLLTVLMFFLWSRSAERNCQAQELTAEELNRRAIQLFNGESEAAAISLWRGLFHDSVGEPRRLVARNLAMACLQLGRYAEAERYLADYLGPEGRKRALGLEEQESSEADGSESSAAGEGLTAEDLMVAASLRQEALVPVVDLEAEGVYRAVLERLRLSHVRLDLDLRPDYMIVMHRAHGDLDRFIAPAYLWLPPGRGLLHFEARGMAPVTTAVILPPAIHEATLEVELSEVSQPSGEGQTESSVRGRGSVRRSESVLEWATLGGGLALAGIGAGCSIRAMLNRDNVNDIPRPANLSPTSEEYRSYVDRRSAIWESDVKPWQTTSHMLYAVGASVALTGLLFLLLPDEEPGAVRLWIEPVQSSDARGNSVILGGKL